MKAQKEDETKAEDLDDANSEGDADDDDAPEDGKKGRRCRVECIMGDRTAEDLRADHPERTTHQFQVAKHTVTITSDFDAGNMARCEQGDASNHFNIWLSSDSMPYYKYTGFRTWFYFAVKGADRGRILHFHLKNMNFQRGLYAAGLKPFYRVGNEGKFKKIPGKISWNNGSDGLQIHFEHAMAPKNPDTLTYFSFVEPWGYEDSMNYFTRMKARFETEERFQENVYFHRELLGYSKEMRYLELVTITGSNKQTEEREKKMEGPNGVLFPAFDPESDAAKLFSTERPFKFDKPVIFLCARVHPGEVQASHVLNGVLDFLMQDTEQARLLLQTYTFKVIPLINPDGVARGYYRLDTHNHNLNRFYTHPCPEQQPTVYCAKRAIVQQQKIGKLKIYIDLHGHASKKGCFIFGNCLQGDAQAANMLFPKLIALNSLNFDFSECNFGQKLMNARDGTGLSREGSGRVGIFQATGIPHSYTLECHYQTGRRLNTLTPKINLETQEIEPEDDLTDKNSKHYKDVRTPHYCVEIFEDVGRSVCIALLEYAQINPISRIPTSHYKNAESIKRELIIHHSLYPYDVLKDLRKEVGKEREAMKQRSQSLLSQIKAKELAIIKREKKRKEREEKAEADEKARLAKMERMAARRAKKKVKEGPERQHAVTDDEEQAMLEKKSRKISIGYRQASDSPAVMMARRSKQQPLNCLKSNKASVFEDEAASGLPDISDSQNGSRMPIPARHASEAPKIDRSLDVGSRKGKRDRQNFPMSKATLGMTLPTRMESQDGQQVTETVSDSRAGRHEDSEMLEKAHKYQRKNHATGQSFRTGSQRRHINEAEYYEQFMVNQVMNHQLENEKPKFIHNPALLESKSNAGMSAAQSTGTSLLNLHKSKDSQILPDIQAMANGLIGVNYKHMHKGQKITQGQRKDLQLVGSAFNPNGNMALQRQLNQLRQIESQEQQQAALLANSQHQQFATAVNPKRESFQDARIVFKERLRSNFMQQKAQTRQERSLDRGHQQKDHQAYSHQEPLERIKPDEPSFHEPRMPPRGPRPKGLPSQSKFGRKLDRDQPSHPKFIDQMQNVVFVAENMHGAGAGKMGTRQPALHGIKSRSRRENISQKTTHSPIDPQQLVQGQFQNNLRYAIVPKDYKDFRGAE